MSTATAEEIIKPRAKPESGKQKIVPPEKKPEEIALPKVVRPNFRLDKAAFRRHNAIIPAELINPEVNLGKSDLWYYVAGDIVMGDEIRCVDEAGRYLAYLYVTFKHGKKVKAAVLEFYNLEDEIQSLETFQNGRYDVVQKGPLKWCIIDTQTGEKIRQGIATRGQAFKELDEFLARFDD